MNNQKKNLEKKTVVLHHLASICYEGREPTFTLERTPGGAQEEPKGSSGGAQKEPRGSPGGAQEKTLCVNYNFQKVLTSKQRRKQKRD